MIYKHELIGTLNGFYIEDNTEDAIILTIETKNGGKEHNLSLLETKKMVSKLNNWIKTQEELLSKL